MNLSAYFLYYVLCSALTPTPLWLALIQLLDKRILPCYIALYSIQESNQIP